MCVVLYETYVLHKGNKVNTCRHCNSSIDLVTGSALYYMQYCVQ